MASAARLLSQKVPLRSYSPLAVVNYSNSGSGIIVPLQATMATAGSSGRQVMQILCKMGVYVDKRALRSKAPADSYKEVISPTLRIQERRGGTHYTISVIKLQLMDQPSAFGSSIHMHKPTQT